VAAAKACAARIATGDGVYKSPTLEDLDASRLRDGQQITAILVDPKMLRSLSSEDSLILIGCPLLDEEPVASFRIDENRVICCPHAGEMRPSFQRRLICRRRRGRKVGRCKPSPLPT